MMVFEISALITAAGHVNNIAKTLFAAHDQVEQDAVRLEMNSAIFELQAKISVIQTQYGELLESNETLKSQLKTYDRWEQESARYALQEIVPGIVAYSLKLSHASGEPGHWVIGERSP